MQREKRRYRVHFIGSGYEEIRSVRVWARNCAEAFERAKDEYKARGYVFDYIEMEAEEI